MQKLNEGEALVQFNQGDNPPPGGRHFRKKTVVRMWRMATAFLCQSREGVFRGEPGDYLAADGHGGFYPVSAEFHAANYEAADADQGER